MDVVEEAGGSTADEAARFATALDYDCMKQVSTLALAALGGIVTLAGSVFAAVADKDGLWVSAGLFALSALAAFQAQDDIVGRVRQRRTPDWRFRAWRSLAAGGLGVGAGVLLGFAYRALG